MRILVNGAFQNQLLLAKNCKHDDCDVSIISSNNIRIYETYYLSKFSLVLFQKYCLGRIKNIEEYDFITMNRQLDNIKQDMANNLKIYLNTINTHYKIKFLILI